MSIINKVDWKSVSKPDIRTVEYTIEYEYNKGNFYPFIAYAYEGKLFLFSENSKVSFGDAKKQLVGKLETFANRLKPNIIPEPETVFIRLKNNSLKINLSKEPL